MYADNAVEELFIQWLHDAFEEGTASRVTFRFKDGSEKHIDFDPVIDA